MSTAWCRWSLLALMALQLLWFAWLFPSPTLPLAWTLTVSLLPLMVVAPGVWRGHIKTQVVGGFFLLFYFSYAVAEGYAEPSTAWIAGAEIALIVVYFMGLLAIRRQPKS